MKSTFLWDVTPRSSMEVHRRFGGYRLSHSRDSVLHNHSRENHISSIFNLRSSLRVRIVLLHIHISSVHSLLAFVCAHICKSFCQNSCQRLHSFPFSHYMTEHVIALVLLFFSPSSSKKFNFHFSKINNSLYHVCHFFAHV